MPNGKSEKVDHLVGVWPHQMSAQYSARSLLDKRFVAVDQLRHSTGGVLIGSPCCLNPIV